MRPVSDFSFYSKKRLEIITTPSPMDEMLVHRRLQPPPDVPRIMSVVEIPFPGVFPASSIKYQIKALRPTAIDCRGLCSGCLYVILKGC